MFGFGKKKTKPAKKSAARKATPKRTVTRETTGAKKKAAPVRKAATPRKTRALCVVCRERTQKNTTLRICGRKRCAAELRQRSQGKPVPAKAAAPRRAPAPRRRAASRTRTTPSTQTRWQATPAAAPNTSGSDLPAWWRDARANAARRQIADWNHHHRQWRDEIVRHAAAISQAAALLSGPDRATLNEIANAAAAITDDHISSAADTDTAAGRSSSIAARLVALGDRLTALTTTYERAGIIRINRSRGTRSSAGDNRASRHTLPDGTTVTNVNHAAPGAKVGSRHGVTSDRRPDSPHGSPRATHNVAAGDDVVDSQIGIDLRRNP